MTLNAYIHQKCREAMNIAIHFHKAGHDRSRGRGKGGVRPATNFRVNENKQVTNQHTMKVYGSCS